MRTKPEDAVATAEEPKPAPDAHGTVDDGTLVYERPQPQES